MNKKMITTKEIEINNNYKDQPNKLAVIMIMIAITSVVIASFIYLYIIPICLFGILISIILRKRSKLFYINIILNIICIILSIIFLIYLKPKPFKDHIGTWYCSYNNQKEYVITLKINNNKEFTWSKYQDDKNNYIIGKYQLKNIDKKNENKIYYYNLIFDSTKYIEKGKEKNNNYHKEYDIAINIEEEKMVLAPNDNIIIKCDKISSENPVIE